MVNIMYVRLSNEGAITDITNNKLVNNTVHMGVKYILGKDSVTFSSEKEGMFVERRRRDITLYKAQLEYGKDYMITPLFVDLYNHTHPIVRDLYAYLKRNFNGKFYIEEDNTLVRPFDMVFSSWVDVKFDYKIKVRVNTNIMTAVDNARFREHGLLLKQMNLYNLHQNLNGKSILIDRESLDIMTSINSLYANDTAII